MAARPIVEEIVWKIDALRKERDDPLAFALTSFVGNENKFTARSIFEFVILDHGSWRPYPQFRSEV